MIYILGEYQKIIQMHQQQVKGTEQIGKTSSRLKSSAFPAFQQVEEHSIFHQIIAHAQQVSQSFSMRPFRQSDVYQLRNLQLEWFPLKYGDYFYHRLLNRHYECVVAECRVQIMGKTLWGLLKNEEEKYEILGADEKKKNHFWSTRLQYFERQQFFQGDWSLNQSAVQIAIIVGGIVFEFTDSRGYLGAAWWGEKVLGQNNSVYISTLGVVEEFRKKKVAQKLLQVALSTAENNNSIKLILLHVIQYNQAAIRLYTKFDFYIFEELDSFYHIDHKPFKGITMGRFFNGGARRRSWREWLNSLW